MKERIVIDRNKIKIEEKDWGVVDAEHCKIEQVPETFEELKELCKELEAKGVENMGEYIYFIKEILFWKNGDITNDSGASSYIAENRSPQQMWNIIKSLVEE